MIEPNALSILRAMPATLMALLAPFDEAALSVPTDEGSAARHVVAHIFDVEQVIFDDRIRRLLDEDRPFIRSIDPLARMNERALLIHQWAYHDLMHLKQAVSILQPPLVASMGNARKFYDL